MEGIRFIHTADLHLDSPFLGLNHLPKELFERIQESTFAAFEKVVDLAIEQAVDFVVIVGDLFDGEDRSIKAQARLRKQMERLRDAEIFAFITHGNHDHLAGSWLMLDMPENVQIFSSEVEMKSVTVKSGCNVHLYGFSYPERHVVDRKISEYEKVGEAHFHIGLLHGHCEGGSSLHQPYAPFSIVEVLQKDMDYWALGHIHKKQILNEDPFIVYPGNIQGRHRNEDGEKGCYIVTLESSGHSQLEFHETDIIRWESVDLNCEENMGLTDLYTIITQHMETLNSIGLGIMLEINLQNPSVISAELKLKIDNGEFLEMLQDGIDFTEAFVWPYKINLNFAAEKENSTLIDVSFIHMLNLAIKDMEKDTFDEAVSSLFSHIYGSRYLTQIEEIEKKALLESAKELIVRQLGN
ncbi:metallophosphoesterase family protein [Lederbergia citrea]|uniref:metallophosphoesterase family protein n=1 Tax=Lederbergia citrea TaxID=2833581 RepID=UPI001BC95063|nr:DNA repair exonuclease [Lederbergia citrea]MBS4177516.1 DNA repair exonuclease [Lederbergia citrea]